MVVGGRELIDTLWNVNPLETGIELRMIVELIDTLWNVNNAPSVSYSLDDTGINRYIMECK